MTEEATVTDLYELFKNLKKEYPNYKVEIGDGMSQMLGFTKKIRKVQVYMKSEKVILKTDVIGDINNDRMESKEMSE